MSKIFTLTRKYKLSESKSLDGGCELCCFGLLDCAKMKLDEGIANQLCGGTSHFEDVTEREGNKGPAEKPVM